MTNMLRNGMIVVATLVAFAMPCFGAVLHVANDGEDSATCGPSSDPCRSIGDAIDNAMAGDRIVVRPGLYSLETEDGGCGGDCVVEIDKAVTVESSEGAEVTMIDAGGDVDFAVRINVDDVVFGGSGKGFLLTGALDDGLRVNSPTSGVTIVGHFSIRNGRHGFRVAGEDHTIEDCWAVRNGKNGFDVGADNVVVTDSSALCNSERGFDLSSDGATLENNIANGNNDDGFRLADGSSNVEIVRGVSSDNSGSGFRLQGTDNTLERSVASGNRDHGVIIADGGGHTVEFTETVANVKNGIRTNVSDVTLTKNNIFGNDETGGNCGLNNNSGDDIDALNNFFGAPGGPSPAEPRDDVCGDTVVTVPAAGSLFGQPRSWLPGGVPSWP